ncbi:MAG: hypothetical protein AAGF27_02245 [Pseudomonadota bacterium]
MQYNSLQDFIERGTRALARGPIALIFVEDNIEVDTTLRHHEQSGFKTVVAFMPKMFDLPADLTLLVERVDYDPTVEAAVETAVNAVIAAASGQWLFYCYNAEYLFFPFCETRSIGEMLAFHTEERRDAMLTYVVDLYADDLAAHPDAVSLDRACLDRSGYYALARKDPLKNFKPKDRQLDFYGGLRWRFEEHVPYERRNIDRIALFRAKPGLTFRADHTLSEEEYNTYSCPWHHNLTAAVCSFRTAKALKSNPGSRYEIETMTCHNTTPFEWHSRQLLDLGLMEPGQWF